MSFMAKKYFRVFKTNNNVVAFWVRANRYWDTHRVYRFVVRFELMVYVLLNY